MSTDESSPSQAIDPLERSSAPLQRAPPLGCLSFFLAGALSVACLWGYARLGGGAAGLASLLVLIVPVLALVTALLVPDLRKRMRGHWTRVLAGLSIPYLLAAFDLGEIMGRRKFDSVVWKAAARGRTEDRIRQVDHLLARTELKGMSRASVMDLLGPDDSEQGTGWGRGYFSDWHAVYWLGTERGFIRIDSEWLVLRFDANDTVSEHALVRD